MGLTIHWEAKNKDKFIEPETAEACVAFVKEIAEYENWQIFAEWNKVVNPSSYDKAGSWNENTKKWDIPPRSQRTASRTIGISVLPHKDSESVRVSFDLDSGKLAAYEQYGQTGTVTNKEFCKTHYAGFDTHRKVCRLLQAIDEHFVPLEVYDEGGYYGVWDNTKGKERFGEYVTFVKSVGDSINGLLGNNVEVHKTEDYSDGWKEDYIDYLVRKSKDNTNNK